MAKVGDRVTVTIRGPNTLAGTATASGTTTILQGDVITAPGKIIKDLIDSWLVEFDEALLGNKRMVIPKDRVSSSRASSSILRTH